MAEQSSATYIIDLHMQFEDHPCPWKITCGCHNPYAVNYKMGDKTFEELLEEAYCDLSLLQKEACTLRAAVNAGADTEAELKWLKAEWFKKERILRTLATRNSVECRSKIKQLRVKLEAYIKQKKRAARKVTHILSCTSEGLSLGDVLKDVKLRRFAFNCFLNDASTCQCKEALKVHKQVFKLLREITVLIRGVQKVSSIKQEIIGLKKAVSDTVNYLESNQSLVIHWFSKVTPVWNIMKLHFNQEYSEMENRDVPSTMNCLHTSNDGSKTQAGTFTVDTDVRSGSCERDNGNLVTSINNAESALECASNCSMKIDCDIAAILKDFEVVSPVSSIHDSLCDSSDRIENIPDYELDCSVMLKDIRTEVQEAVDINSCNKDGTQFTANAKGTPFAAHDNGPSVMSLGTKEIYGLDDTVKELNSVHRISSLDDLCCELSDSIENVPSFGDGGTEIQKAADVNNCNKESAQFISDAIGTLIPSAAYEDGPYIFLEREENATFNSKELEFSWRTERQNLPEEHIVKDNAEDMIVHYSLQEASNPMVPYLELLNFFDYSSCSVPVINCD